MKLKKKSKAIISLALCVAILASVYSGIVIHSYGASQGISDGLRWYLSDNGVFTVSRNSTDGEDNGGWGANYSAAISLPWYSNRSKIKKVIVDGGVAAIGDRWFYGCSNLAEVELPASLLKLGANCFYNCKALKNITIPSGCTELYDNTFNGCTSLKWAIMPEDVKDTHQVPSSFFYGCSALENVMLGSGITSTASGAFRSCSSLKSIIWTGDTISSIGSNFPSGVSFVGNGSIESFCSSNSFTYVPLSGSCGNGLTYTYSTDDMSLTINGNADMSSAPWNIWRYFITSVDFGGAQSICANAFNGCENLTGPMNIPATIELVGENAFANAGCDYYYFNADEVDVQVSALVKDGGTTTVFGKADSFLYDYALAERDLGNDVSFYCTDGHKYTVSGNTKVCEHCDKTYGDNAVESIDGGSYIYHYRVGTSLYFDSKTLSDYDYEVTTRDLLIDFDNHLTADTGDAYTQTDYDGRFDIIRDGYVNAKDYAILVDMAKGEETDYDMFLSNPNATPQAQALYKYICSVWGSKVISGQQESTWVDGPDYEMNYIYNSTGRYPAIRGLDFMGDDFNGCVSRAESWAQRGGIVSICWHCSSAFDQSYDASKADEFTTAQWEAVLTEGTAEHAAFIQGMDKAGNALLQLQAQGIPVLWRPFHEFDGAWFWWGKGGSDYFKRLWIMMYEHFTNDLGLNNLIWVLGYSHNGIEYNGDLESWYPGNQYCDMTGADSYKVNKFEGEERLYKNVDRFVNGAKPLCLHETGLIPTVEQFEIAPWVYFLTWHTTYITADNTAAQLNVLYNSEYVITLDELPDFYG